MNVGAVAAAAGVSVRTLHHWDAVGLLVPHKGANGYRDYGPAELARLQQVLTYRELGFGLDDVKALLDDPATDALAHLRRQQELLAERIARLQSVAALVGRAVEARSMGIDLEPHELREVFGSEDPTQWQDEAQQRWGDTDAYRQSHARTSSYDKVDWLRVKAEMADVEARFAAALAAGVPATSVEAQALAEEHRQHISRSYYDCSPEMHVALAEMYVGDERFTAHYERVAPGLAQYVHDAVHANDRRSLACAHERRRGGHRQHGVPARGRGRVVRRGRGAAARRARQPHRDRGHRGVAGRRRLRARGAAHAGVDLAAHARRARRGLPRLRLAVRRVGAPVGRALRDVRRRGAGRRRGRVRRHRGARPRQRHHRDGARLLGARGCPCRPRRRRRRRGGEGGARRGGGDRRAVLRRHAGAPAPRRTDRRGRRPGRHGAGRQAAAARHRRADRARWRRCAPRPRRWPGWRTSRCSAPATARSTSRCTTWPRRRRRRRWRTACGRGCPGCATCTSPRSAPSSARTSGPACSGSCVHRR